MGCKRPLKGFIIPSKLNDKGYEIKVQGSETQSMVLRSGRWFGSNQLDPVGEKVVTEYVDIPCGSCYGCRLDYSREWADRCLMELEEHDSAYFLTLTYRDDELPYPSFLTVDGRVRPYTSLDPDTGEVDLRPTLRKKDVQNFHKRLRKQTGQKIRYFCAGEYGDQTQRPHYHCIEFGLVIDDLVPYKFKNGYWLYNSKTLDEIWGHGNVIIGDCSWETCAYTARYVMKKANGKTGDYYDSLNIEREFVLMSRKPGIGRTFFEKYGEEIYKFRSIPISHSNGVHLVRPTNRYFDKLMESRDSVKMQAIKDERMRQAQHAELLRDAQTSMKKLDRLLAEEEVLQAKTNSLLRIDI